MLFKSVTLISLIITVLSGLGQPVWLWPLIFAGAFLALFVLAWAICAVICAFIDLDKPVEKESKFYRQAMYFYVDGLIDLFLVKLKTRGLEKTPKDGRFLLVCNHQQMADPGILLSCFRESQLTFISKQENRKLPIINKFMHNIRCQLIDRDNDRQALKAILECIRMIKADEVSVAVFPEGYTSKDGKLHPFRPGVFKIAQKANVPIVVCTINDTRPIFHNAPRLKRTPVELHLVDVIPAQELVDKTTMEISNRVYDMMIADLGEEFRPEA